MSDVIVLDVGHGNSAIVRSEGHHAIVDSPVGGLLLNTLEDLDVDKIQAVFISHADRDHLAGILALLCSPKIHVERVFVNPDSQKKTKTWYDFLDAVSVAERNGSCVVETSLTTTTPGQVELGSVFIDIVTPSSALALKGVGQPDEHGRPITSNSLSAALSIKVGSDSGLLLAGDLDEIGLDDAIKHKAHLQAGVLVYPHHGGLPGASADSSGFFAKLLSQVQPETVIFSNGRGRHDNPQPEIVDAVLKEQCKIACTQLSKLCCGDISDHTQDHLEPIRSHGRRDAQSCAGSISINLGGGARRIVELEALHREFVDTSVPSPLCRRQPH